MIFNKIHETASSQIMVFKKKMKFLKTCSDTKNAFFEYYKDVLKLKKWFYMLQAILVTSKLSLKINFGVDALFSSASSQIMIFNKKNEVPKNM